MEYDKEQIRHTLAAILHAQHETTAAELLDTAKPEIVMTGTDFGIDYYSLVLRIPATKFGIMEPSLRKIAKKIEEKLSISGFNSEGKELTQVQIFPEPVISSGAISVPVPTKTDEKRIWEPNRIRLFLSHVSKFKLATSALKKALAAYGIDGFVAHEDILPTVEWQKEIEFALRSMHMLCAIVTEDFNKSLWADQEVGFALGRGVPVVAIRCGADPYGLLGKHQALSADIGKLDSAAPMVANIVAQQLDLLPQMMDGLVDSLCASYSFQQSKDAMRLITKLAGNINDAQTLRLLEAARDNTQVRDAHGVPSQIMAIAKQRAVNLPAKAPTGEFDDDIPF